MANNCKLQHGFIRLKTALTYHSLINKEGGYTASYDSCVSAIELKNRRENAKHANLIH